MRDFNGTRFRRSACVRWPHKRITSYLGRAWGRRRKCARPTGVAGCASQAQDWICSKISSTIRERRNSRSANAAIFSRCDYILEGPRVTTPELQQAIAKLTDIQTQAVNYSGGALLVLAGPGSGKTQVLTCRIATLLDGSRDKNFRVLAL